MTIMPFHGLGYYDRGWMASNGLREAAGVVAHGLKEIGRWWFGPIGWGRWSTGGAAGAVDEEGGAATRSHEGHLSD